MQLTMTVLRCPDSVAPETRNVSGGEFSVGRGPGVDWVLPDPERLLSKRHFAVAFRGGSWQLADTSTNGTFLNREGDPIGAGDVRSLRDGDRLRLGVLRDRGAAGRGCGRASGRSVQAQSVRRSVWHGSVRARRGRSAIRSTNRTIRACASLRPRRSCRPISIRWRRNRARRRSAVRPRRIIRRSCRMHFSLPQPVGQMPLHSGGVIPGDDLLPDDWDKDLLEGIALARWRPPPPPPVARTAPPHAPIPRPRHRSTSRSSHAQPRPPPPAPASGRRRCRAARGVPRGRRHAGCAVRRIRPATMLELGGRSGTWSRGCAPC